MSQSAQMMYHHNLCHCSCVFLSLPEEPKDRLEMQVEWYDFSPPIRHFFILSLCSLETFQLIFFSTFLQGEMGRPGMPGEKGDIGNVVSSFSTASLFERSSSFFLMLLISLRWSNTFICLFQGSVGDPGPVGYSGMKVKCVQLSQIGLQKLINHVKSFISINQTH